MPETSPIADEKLVDTLPNSSEAAAPENAGELYDQVAKVVEIIRPAVQADKGDIFLRTVDSESGAVTVELVGACVSCPASTQTLKQGLERILKDRVPGITSVEHVGAQLRGSSETDFEGSGETGTPVSL